MSDFAQFREIFKDCIEKKKKVAIKRKATPTHSASKRRSDGGNVSRLSSVFKSSEKRKIQTESMTFKITPRSLLDSVDKAEILPYLSCNIEDDDDLELPSTPHTEDNQQTTVDLQAANHEIYSPVIEEFSEGDDIFLRSQEGELIAKMNECIAKIHHQKPRYKPLHKTALAGGLLERLRAVKSKRLSVASKFADATEAKPEQQKIEIIDFCDFRRRLLVKFKFLNDEPSIFDPCAPSTHHFLVLAAEFKKVFQQHSFYDIVFDLPEREFLDNQFIHFGQLIRAGRMV